MSTSSKTVKIITRIGSLLLFFAVMKLFGVASAAIMFIVYALLEGKLGAVYSLIITVIVGFACVILFNKLLYSDETYNTPYTKNSSLNNNYNTETINNNLLDEERDSAVLALSSISPKRIDEITTLIGANRSGDRLHYKYHIENIEPQVLMSSEFARKNQEGAMSYYCSEAAKPLRDIFPGGITHDYYDSKMNKSEVPLYPYMCNQK